MLRFAVGYAHVACGYQVGAGIADDVAACNADVASGCDCDGVPAYVAGYAVAAFAREGKGVAAPSGQSVAFAPVEAVAEAGLGLAGLDPDVLSGL